MQESAQTSDGIVRTENLTKKFGELVAVDDVSWSLREGETRAVIGPNGAGKSTFLRLLTGEMKPTRGKIYLDGEDITSLDQHEICNKGMVKSYQHSSLFDGLTAVENVRIAIQRAHTSRLSVWKKATSFESHLEKAYELLEKVKLEDMAEETASDLSHGDKRKLDIALAIAMGAKVILLDEPTSGMSQSETEETVELLDKITKGITLLLVEHNIQLVLDNADRITVLENGRIIADGTPSEISTNERVQKSYLGTS